MKFFTVFTKQGRVEIPMPENKMAQAEAIMRNPLGDITEKLREMNDLSNKLTKVQIDEVEKVEFIDVDGKTVTLLKGGPGSGCQGPNCGRPHSVTVAGKTTHFPDKDSADAFVQQENAKQQRENNYHEIKQTTASDKKPAVSRIIKPTVGSKVKVVFGSGLASGKLATVVPSTEIRTDGRGIPTNVEGAYKPVDWKRETAIRYEDGKYDTMFNNRLVHPDSPEGRKPAEKPYDHSKDITPSAQDEVTNAPRQHGAESNAKFKTEIDNRQVGRTITDQLGGRKFQAMTGAKDFLLHDKAISFKVPKAKDGITHVKVSLAPDDTYDVDFKSVRGTAVKDVHNLKGIHADQLQSIFTEKTGLDTHL